MATIYARTAFVAVSLVAMLCNALAAPVVVTPGTQAGYIYFPPASVGGSGPTPGGDTLANGGDANGNNCTVANIFPTVVTANTSGSVVIPKTVKCLYLEAGGAKGTKGFDGYDGQGGPGGRGAVTKTVVFNNSGVDLTLSWTIGLANANGGVGGDGVDWTGTHTGGPGGAGVGFSGPMGLLLMACGGGGGGGSGSSGVTDRYGLGGASPGGEAGTKGSAGYYSNAGGLAGSLCTGAGVGLNPSVNGYVKYAY